MRTKKRRFRVCGGIVPLRSRKVAPQRHRRAPAPAGGDDGVVGGRGGRLVDELDRDDSGAADVMAVVRILPNDVAVVVGGPVQADGHARPDTARANSGVACNVSMLAMTPLNM